MELLALREENRCLEVETYLENQFYHIPKKYLANVRLGVEYIAFYQQIPTFREDSGIFYYGKIKYIIEYKRDECKELPTTRRKGQIYLRFNIEDIRTISKIRPIQILLRLISYTTLYLLNNAENMHELKIKNNLEM